MGKRAGEGLGGMSEDKGSFYPCIVVSTTGRVAYLRRLLDSLSDQEFKCFAIGICDQSGEGAVAPLIDEYKGRLRIFETTSERGLSAGRNSVLRAAPAESTHFLFPNDSTYYEKDFLHQIRERHCAADIAAFSYVDQLGVRYKFDSGQYQLDLRNVWKIIEAGMLVSRRVLGSSRFDEAVGTGSPSPWQSGEGTDLLLRLLTHEPSVHWNPELRVYGVTQDVGLSEAARRRKLRIYGRGYGYIHRKWNYPVHRRVLICVGPVIRAIVRGGFLDAWSSSLGRFEGVTGWVLGR